jgi:hypothetical protein
MASLEAAPEELRDPRQEVIRVAEGKSRAAASGGAGGIWFLGFIGALVYYIHYHSGTFWLVVLAFLKSVVWPAFVVYHVLQLK